jgi:hypothetical protein
MLLVRMERVGWDSRSAQTTVPLRRLTGLQWACLFLTDRTFKADPLVQSGGSTRGLFAIYPTYIVTLNKDIKVETIEELDANNHYLLWLGVSSMNRKTGLGRELLEEYTRRTHTMGKV